MKLDPESLQAAARHCCANGIEKTPDELDGYVRELIRSYREAAAGGGRHDIALAYTDAQVWDSIKDLLAWAGPESGEPIRPTSDDVGMN